MNVDPVTLAILQGLIAEGAVFRHQVEHSWPGCDGRMTCVCPRPSYSFRVASEYRDALEAARS